VKQSKNNGSIKEIAIALFNRDVGRSLPLGMGPCDEYGMKGLCGPDCPDYSRNDYCVDEASVFDDEEDDLALDDDRYLWVPEFDDQ
jgi:hypothetical protein